MKRITLTIEVPDDLADAVVVGLRGIRVWGAASATPVVEVVTCQVCGHDSDLAPGRRRCADRDACRDRYRDQHFAGVDRIGDED